jgi:cytochrome c
MGPVDPLYFAKLQWRNVAKQIEALVDKASALIDSKGKSIFPEFRKTGSEWRMGNTYLFIADLKG